MSWNPFGSPAQHETFDPKPDALPEVRGEMDPIATAVSDVKICEGLPRTAKVIDRVTVVRSMTHPYPLHGVAYALTGMPTYSAEIEDRPSDAAHWPFIGDRRLPRSTWLRYSSRAPAFATNL